MQSIYSLPSLLNPFWPGEVADRVLSMDQIELCNDSICHCLSPDRTRHKVNDPKVDYCGDLGEGKVGHEPRLEPYWTVLVIDPLSTMWV